MALSSLRILLLLECNAGIIRAWDGNGGPFVDADGEIWRPCVLADGSLDSIECAMNGEATSLSLSLSGVDSYVSNIIWEDYQAGEINGSILKIYIQKLDESEQPLGAPRLRYTGILNNLLFDTAAGEKGIQDLVTIEFRNRFALRTLTSGAVLSDTDQRARSAINNPSSPPDRICENVPGLSQRTIRWPEWTSGGGGDA